MINIYRKAVYEACVVAGIPVYDYWVTDKPFPYVIISNVAVDDRNLKMNKRNDFAFTVDIFDKEEGKSSVVAYANEIAAVLSEIDGVNVQISTRYLSDIQPNVMHAIQTLRFTKYEKREVM